MSANYTDLFTIKDDGTIIAKTFVGNVTGNISGSSGSCTGNAATATKLQTGRKINNTRNKLYIPVNNLIETDNLKINLEIYNG